MIYIFSTFVFWTDRMHSFSGNQLTALFLPFSLFCGGLRGGDPGGVCLRRKTEWTNASRLFLRLYERKKRVSFVGHERVVFAENLEGGWSGRFSMFFVQREASEGEGQECCGVRRGEANALASLPLPLTVSFGNMFWGAFFLLFLFLLLLSSLFFSPSPRTPYLAVFRNGEGEAASCLVTGLLKGSREASF